jgi:predicted amidohydrolase
MRALKIAVLQYNARSSDVEYNLAKLSGMLAQLRSQGVDLAVLPEFFTTGNTFEPEVLERVAKTTPVVAEWLYDTARELNLMIAGACLAWDGNEVYNKFFFQEPEKPARVHLKMYSPAVESVCYADAPPNPNIVETSAGKVGLITCVEAFYEDIVLADYSDCVVVLMVFAIPNFLAYLPSFRKGLRAVPKLLARRCHVPVALCSMGGPFHSKGSPLFPVRISLGGKYAGRSGLYFPDRPDIRIHSNDEEQIIAELPPRAARESIDRSIVPSRGPPPFIRLHNLLFKSRANAIHKLYVNRL